MNIREKIKSIQADTFNTQLTTVFGEIDAQYSIEDEKKYSDNGNILNVFVYLPNV